MFVFVAKFVPADGLASLQMLAYIYNAQFLVVNQYAIIFMEENLFENVCGNIFAALNSFWPSDAIWRYRSRSTLARVMACFLTARSHYLNQRWLLTSEVLRHSPESKFTSNAEKFNQITWIGKLHF